MELIIDRATEIENAKIIVVRIGNIKYKLSESVDSNLVVNKTSLAYDEDENLFVMPKYANQIELH